MTVFTPAVLVLGCAIGKSCKMPQLRNRWPLKAFGKGHTQHCRPPSRSKHYSKCRRPRKRISTFANIRTKHIAYIIIQLHICIVVTGMDSRNDSNLVTAAHQLVVLEVEHSQGLHVQLSPQVHLLASALLTRTAPTDCMMISVEWITNRCPMKLSC
ncbi:hypothetical protein EDD17DRAFT_1563852 [Pisolithus thermaeus]|nr:hypothetical protein EDD17DRAFT_1563852 [Pisolithus thermaeus]